MAQTTVRVDADQIKDWPSFHRAFADAFGFPEFYGLNMDAWIDCLTYLDDPSSGMTKVHTTGSGVVSLVVDNAANFKKRCPEQFASLVECAAFVNWRRMEKGDVPVLDRKSTR